MSDGYHRMTVLFCAFVVARPKKGQAKMNVNNEVHTPDEPTETELSDRLYSELKNIVESYDVYQNNLAAGMDISETAVSYLLNGTRTVTLDTICAVCIALKITPHDQRALFSRIDCSMPDYDGHGDEREKIIRHYMDFCCKDRSLTVKKCNRELRSKNCEPLTGKRGKKNG